MYRRVLLASTLLLAAPLAAAQDWDWTIAPYLWAAGIEGESGLGVINTDISVDFADLVDVLDGAILLHVEAEQDTFGLFGDLVFMGLEADSEPATAGGLTETEFDTTIVELGYLKKLSAAGVEFGIRYWDLELALHPTTLPDIERKQDWIDAFVGMRVSREISDKWNWTTRINLGAGGSDVSFGFGTTFGRELGSGQIVMGLKLLDIDYEDLAAGGLPFRVDATFLGATIGYAF